MQALPQPGDPGEASCQAAVEHGVGLYRVELQRFDARNPGERTFPGLDLVDSWAVGYLEGETLRVQAQSQRSHRTPALDTVLQAPVFEGQLALRVSDVFGRSHYFRWDGGETAGT